MKSPVKAPCKSSEMSGPRCVNTCDDIPASYVTTAHQRVHAETAQRTYQDYTVLVMALLIQVPLPSWFIIHIFPLQPFLGIFKDEIGNLYINLLLFLYTSTTWKILSMLINLIVGYKHRWDWPNFVTLHHLSFRCFRNICQNPTFPNVWQWILSFLS